MRDLLLLLADLNIQNCYLFLFLSFPSPKRKRFCLSDRLIIVSFNFSQSADGFGPGRGFGRGMGGRMMGGRGFGERLYLSLFKSTYLRYIIHY